MKSTVLALALVAGHALSAGGQQTQKDAFKWNGRVTAGHWVRVHNLNGPITVGAASGDNVEVVATSPSTSASALSSAAAAASVASPRAHTVTRHPSAINARAVARPSPLLEPVMMATLPVSSRST